MDSLFMRFPGYKTKTVTLSYDDGLEYDARLMSILDKYGLKCTFNISSGCFHDDDSEKTRGRMSRKKCIELYQNSGHEVAIHGLHHKYMEQLPYASAMYEVIEDRRRLEHIFGRIIRGMAYPYGTYNEKILDILSAAGIAYARTTLYTEGFDLPDNWLTLRSTCKHTNPRLGMLTDEFLSCKADCKPVMFYLWGHSSEYEHASNWNIIESFAQKTGKRSDIWYATNIEIYDYVSDYNSLQFSVDTSIVHNPTSREIYFNYADKNYNIKPGETKTVI